MNPILDLLKAIRAGNLTEVRLALDAGAQLESPDEPGLAIGMACFYGHLDIVRELVARGAAVNFPDNRMPDSPLSMAVRGCHLEVVRSLIELGAVVPAGMETGLSARELTVAQWMSVRHDRPGSAVDTFPHGAFVEEIEMTCPGFFDTSVLESDMVRLARSMD
jgi:hypothetical protein